VRPSLPLTTILHQFSTVHFSRNCGDSVNARRLFEKSGIRLQPRELRTATYSITSSQLEGHLTSIEQTDISNTVNSKIPTISTSKDLNRSIDPAVNMAPKVNYLCLPLPHFTQLTTTDHYPPLRLRQHPRPLRIPSLRSLRRARK
jgi:hypothetical protein